MDDRYVGCEWSVHPFGDVRAMREGGTGQFVQIVVERWTGGTLHYGSVVTAVQPRWFPEMISAFGEMAYMHLDHAERGLPAEVSRQFRDLVEQPE